MEVKGNAFISKIKKIFAFQDLTNGRPFKTIILFGLPILISNLLGTSLSLINTLVLKSTVGSNSVVAMNQTGAINSLLFQFSFGCASGFSVIGSQKAGAKDIEGLKKVLNVSIVLTTIIAIIISILGLSCIDPLMNFLNIDAIFYEKAKTYILIILGFFILSALNNLVSNFLRALGNSTFPLIVSLSTSLLNILLVFLFTAQNLLSLDTLGCGIANTIVIFLSLLINYFYLIKKHPSLKFSFKSAKFDKTIYYDLLKLGLPLGFQWSILFIGSFVQNSQINLYGPDASSAMTCYSQFENYLTIVFSVLASSLLTFVGQNYGARKYKRIRKGILETSLTAIILYVVICLIGIVSAKYVPYIFLNAEDINSEIVYYVSIYLYIISPSLIMQALLMISRSSLQGIKKPLIPFLSGIGELIARIVVCFLLPYLIDNNYQTTHSDSSYIGLCFSNPAAWLISFILMGGATLIFIIFNSKFKENGIIEKELN